MNQKKIIIWTQKIDDLINEHEFVGGLNVQMFLWAQTFTVNKWKVYSFSETKKRKLNEIQFLKFPTIKYIGIVVEFIYSLYYILCIKPDAIFYRGASRGLCFVSLFSKVTNTKLVYLAASNLNFLPGKEYVSTYHDKLLYRIGVRYTDFFIVQNTFQMLMLSENYKKNASILIPNIWPTTLRINSKKNNEEKRKIILWVGNFRHLKRPEWFIDLAKQFPQEDFFMVGSPLDLELFDKCRRETKEVENLTFLGGKSFSFVNDLFKSTKILVCTSEVEGFPNTFLQAWSNNIPVLSTFDPSNVILNYAIGKVVTDKNELFKGFEYLCVESQYAKIQENIKCYFENNHNPQMAYDKVVKLICADNK